MPLNSAASIYIHFFLQTCAVCICSLPILIQTKNHLGASHGRGRLCHFCFQSLGRHALHLISRSLPASTFGTIGGLSSFFMCEIQSHESSFLVFWSLDFVPLSYLLVLKLWNKWIGLDYWLVSRSAKIIVEDIGTLACLIVCGTQMYEGPLIVALLC